MSLVWNADELQRATGGTMHVPFAATGISIDTRTLQPGDLFIALVGDHSNGHAFVLDALSRGAAGAMVHQDSAPPDAPVLRVDDTMQALHALGRAGRTRFASQVVAITGSVGKTTTKEMLRTALSAFGPTHAAEASYNNHWGVPLTLARLPQDARFCIAEIGMNHPGEIEPLAKLVRPHVVVITAIEPAHIGQLGSIEAIADEKAMISRALEPGGIAVLPGDSPHLALLALPGVKRRLFGRTSAPDGWLRSSETHGAEHQVEAEIDGHPVAFRLAAPGAHMAMDAVAALTVCAALGLDPARAAQALEAFAPVAGRGVHRPILNGRVSLLDESYNASSASVRAALSVLREMQGRRLAVLGDMLELGKFSAAEHRSLAPDVTESADMLYACGPQMRHLFDAVPESYRGAHAADSATLAPVVADAVRPGDVVLVKGSLGSRMRLIVNALEGRS